MSTITELHNLFKTGIALKHLGFAQTTKICSLASDALPQLDENVETLYMMVQFEEHFNCKLGKKDDKIKNVLLNFDSEELKDLFYAAHLPMKKGVKAFKDSISDRVKSFMPKLITDWGYSYAENDESESLGLKSAMLI